MTDITSTPLTPAEVRARADRVVIATIAAHTRWSRTVDRAAATAPARQALLDRFAREVDPDGTLDAATRAKLAENARRAYFRRLSRQGVQARQSRARASSKSAETDQ